MGLEQIVNVNITRQTAGVSQAGFGVPLILGPNSPAPSEIRSYSSLSAVAEDYDTSDAEYLKAAKIFSQNPKLPLIKIGNLSTAVAQIHTFTPNVTVQSIATYSVVIDEVEYSFESDSDPTAAEVVAGLISEINGDAEAKVTASGTTTLIVTADNAGEPFTVGTSSANMGQGTATQPSVGVANDILDAIEIDNDWYFLLVTSQSDVTVKQAALTIESLRKIYVFMNDDSDVRSAATDDLISELVALGYFRTAVFYTGTLTDHPDAAFIGRVAPLDPGSETWANKTLAGVTVDAWTDAEQANLDSKNANYYIQVAGLNVTMNGKVVGDEYIDIIRFIDWLQARMQEGIFQDLYSLDKVPFTDAGIAVIESRLRAVLQAGVSAGGIPDSDSYTVTVPKAKDISSADKAARRLTGVTFTATLSGAIHAATINGTVSL